MTNNLTIEFPERAELPNGIAENQDLLRYMIAASLYQRGLISGAAARELTGDGRRHFEEKMSEYGFALAGNDAADLALELDA